jgi:A/G-specific adenine glycosylase
MLSEHKKSETVESISKISGERKVLFTKKLLVWNAKTNNREMPWKGEKSPYKIWLSEIILQQTRVEQGLAYYNRFIDQYPTVQALAAADETSVFKLWEGLGYYTRCKNLIATAKIIANDLNGNFPDTYDGIIALKGIGPYTAAAIGSFAFNLPHAVVDGNVYRVLSRFFGIEIPIDSTEGKKLYAILANELLPVKTPGTYNQALMDFGAVICKPQLPLCSSCALSKECKALSSKKVNLLPIKEKFIIKKKRWFYYFILEHNGGIYVRKRGPKDIWENLYEFVLIEKEAAWPLEKIIDEKAIKFLLGKQKATVLFISDLYKQQLTHQTIYGQFVTIKLEKQPILTGYQKIENAGLWELPFPKFINNYLEDKNVSLNLF